MTVEDILKDVKVIFTDVLDDDSIELTMETTAHDIEDWDSLNNIHLVVEIEKHFNIRFTSSEIQKFRNVADMCIDIGHKLEDR
ncbi:MAG: acyl carrier protein [Thermodesulfobacteriota bacterium]|nr:acyl carrier protein [Thermodesulfobacteriota bacterium]